MLNRALNAVRLGRIRGVCSRRWMTGTAVSIGDSAKHAASQAGEAATPPNQEIQQQQQPPRQHQDLHAMLCQDGGFSDGQADALLKLIAGAINESAAVVTQTMVHPSELDKVKSSSKDNISKLRMDIRNLSVLDYGALRAELKRIASELEKLRNGINNDVLNTHGSVQLDINLEKKRVASEINSLELAVVAAEAKIEREMGLLVDKIDRMRNDMRQGFINFLGACGLLFVSFNAYTYHHRGSHKKKTESASASS
ncbi:hypothetical protein HDU78_000581 [Chytriomyces hyalinus]|nr:hypothetical protein HDU78_000581 [Chytriomyces hyalinus]